MNTSLPNTEDHLSPEDESVNKGFQRAYEQLEQRVQTRTAELHESEQRYKNLLESITNYVYTVNIKDGEPVSTVHGPGCLPVTGYTPDEYANNIYLWHKMVHADDQETVIKRAQRLISGENMPPLEHRIIHKDGSVRWVQNRSVVRRNNQDEVIAYDGIIIDVTERKQTELEKDHLLEEVSRQQRQLRALSGRLAEAQETERKRLAHELHDQVGQNLTALGINLNLIASQLHSNNPAMNVVQTRLTDSLQLLEETSDKIYNVMADLRPPVLDDYGLVATLRWYGEQWAKRVGLNITINGTEPKPRLASPTENALFRIVQEALTNVAKHAQAENVTINVYDYNNGKEMIRLEVEDDGIGFEPQKLISHTKKRQHWGLMTMRERAESIGGQCWVESQQQDGTRVIVEIARDEISS